MRTDSEAVLISAEGEIGLGDKARFKEFLLTASLFEEHRIVFNSPGGNDTEAIRLSRVILQRGFRTAVRATVPNGEYSQPVLVFRV